MGQGGGAVLQLLSPEQEEKNKAEGLVQFKDEPLSQWDYGLTEAEGTTRRGVR